MDKVKISGGFMTTRERIVGQDLRLSLLPRRMPVLEGAELAVAWRPAGAVSGDYFDVIRFDESRAALCVGDVMGKGMPAALVMSDLAELVRGLAWARQEARRKFAAVER